MDGNKPIEVLIEPKQKSNFDNTQTVRHTSGIGHLSIPFHMDVLPDDTIDINLNTLIKSQPLSAPLLGTYRIQYDFFFSPWKNYLNALHTDKMSDIRTTNLPTFNIPFDTWSDNCLMLQYLGVQRNCISSYAMDEDGEWISKSGYFRTINAIPILSLWDAYLHYYINANEKYVPIYYYLSEGLYETQAREGETIGYQTRWFLLTDLINFFRALKDILQNGQNLDLKTYCSANGPYCYDTEGLSFRMPYYIFLGLPLRTYMRDLYNNRVGDMFQTAPAGLSTTESFVNVDSNKFSINSLRQANSIQKFLDRSAIGGTRYSEFLRSMFCVDAPRDFDFPSLIASHSTYLNFDPITCADSSGYTKQQGQGQGFISAKNGKIHFDEYGYLFCVCSIIPCVSYSGGISHELTETKMTDCYMPVFDNLGLQDTPMKNFIISNTETSSDNVSIGKLPAWSRYKTNLNRTYGFFADSNDSLHSWVNTRFLFGKSNTAYSEGDWSQIDIIENDLESNSTYVLPDVWDASFIEAGGTNHFYISSRFDVFSNRQMSKSLPSL